ncbi:hypothetical protein C9374_003120 [Naegleria lovaniensis]|uniref:Aspartyl/asparaginy/proline hydroxylase domain-containing protein n=1 Tax=Naegleria lovaniensis TaxID=51637 RepID=A0AA88GUE0_NAELO|nr:uncharacterized protein C9374_003120 [Naegleria lovaniensis]KAG2385971.1 hypothetical protein C9374_003120 [Naegleria lovaniensis]
MLNNSHPHTTNSLSGTQEGPNNTFVPSVNQLNQTKRIMIKELLSVYEFNDEILLKTMKMMLEENDENTLEISQQDVKTNSDHLQNSMTTNSSSNISHDTSSITNQLEDYLIEYAPLRLIYCLYQFLIKGNRLHQRLRYPNLFVYPQIGSDEPYYDPHYIDEHDFIHDEEEDLDNNHNMPQETYNYSIFRSISLDLESNFEMIRNEFIQVYSNHFNTCNFMDRIQSSVNGQWNAIYLVNQGKLDDESISKFPKTFQLLDSILGFEDGRICRLNIGYVYFSIIHEGTHILPHCGVSNIKLRIQLPLIVPLEKNQERNFVTMKVKNIERQYREGQIMILDDSFVHEVKYQTSSSELQHDEFVNNNNNKTTSLDNDSSSASCDNTSTINNNSNRLIMNDIHSSTIHTTTSIPSLNSIRVVLLIDIYHPDLVRDEIQLLHLFFDNMNGAL